MRHKKIWIPAVVLALALASWALVFRGGDDGSSYRYATVERGEVLQTVSATGALQATKTVEVGTQVSGQVSAIYADFNDHVKAGQLVARIDPTLLLQEVRSAEANLQRAKAELDQTSRDLERQKGLHEQKVVTDSELEQSQYQYQVALASYKSSQVNLERAQRNLGYSEIRSPIDGVVVERNVDVGQTVAASLSAPTLFLIAQDLSSMEILATVDESDIGSIHQGQEARFSVQAYPEQTFTGTVRQVRLQSTTAENVVSYLVVVEVANDDGKLLPGMTATVDFVVNRAENALYVANTALRFRPTEQMQAVLEQRRASGDSSSVMGAGFRGGRPDSATLANMSDSARAAMRARRAEFQARAARGDFPGGGPGGPGGGNGQFRRPTTGSAGGQSALLWYVGEDGRVNAMAVRTGISDGQNTVVRGPNVKEGMQVIAAVTTSSGSSEGTNPFQQQTQDRRRPGGF